MNHIKPKTLSKTNRTSLFFYGLSMLTSFLNFLYYPLLSRLLPVNIYGEVQFIVTILFQISILFFALNITSILLSLKYSESAPLLSRKVTSLSSALNIGTAVLTVLLVITLSAAHSLFRFENPLAFIAMGIAIISTVPLTLGVGLLQGKDRYIDAGVLNTLGSGLKLVFSTLLVVIGLGASGAILGIAVGQLLGVLLFALRRDGGFTLPEVMSFKKFNINILKPDLLLIAGSIWIVIINVIMSLDTVVSKITLPAQQAGEYAGVATLAKIAIFAVSPLMWLAIPSSVRYIEKKKTVANLIGIASIFCALLTAAYLLFGDWILTILVGAQYLAMSHLLPLATIGASLLAIAAMLGVVLVGRQLYRHAALQATLMVFVLLVMTAFYCSQGHSLLLSILVAQATSGGVGIVYYSIIKTIKS